MDSLSDHASAGTPSSCLSKPGSDAAIPTEVRFGEAPVRVPQHLDKPRLRRWEATEYLLIRHGLTVAPATLAKAATCGGGPPFQSFGRFPLYEPAALDEWAIAKLGAPRRSTSDKG